ncbi:hypothetical protein SB773_30415, partial [Bacillus sp. SIMBA_074]|uniref:hypothetical protein n=1 Tax=Bacillus sp. SIMBA_074 TaxID=3085812 RepID=UPI00397839F0
PKTGSLFDSARVVLTTEKPATTGMSASIVAVTVCFMTLLPKWVVVSVIATAVPSITVSAAFPEKAGTFFQ